MSPKVFWFWQLWKRKQKSKLQQKFICASSEKPSKRKSTSKDLGMVYLLIPELPIKSRRLQIQGQNEVVWKKMSVFVRAVRWSWFAIQVPKSGVWSVHSRRNHNLWNIQVRFRNDAIIRPNADPKICKVINSTQNVQTRIWNLEVIEGYSTDPQIDTEPECGVAFWQHCNAKTTDPQIQTVLRDSGALSAGERKKIVKLVIRVAWVLN